MKYRRTIFYIILALILLGLNYPYSIKEYKAGINPAGHGDLRLVVWLIDSDNGETEIETALIDDTWRIDRITLDTSAIESKMIVKKSLAVTHRHLIMDKGMLERMLEYSELHGFKFHIQNFKESE